MLFVTHITIQTTPTVFASVAHFQATKADSLFFDEINLVLVYFHFKQSIDPMNDYFVNRTGS